MLSASAGALTLPPGGSLQLKAIAIDGAGGQRDITSMVTWQSSDPEKAVATPSGLVKGGMIGAVDVSATLDGVTGKASIDIRLPPTNCAAATLSENSVSVTPFNTVVWASVTTPSSDCRWTAVSDSSWLNPGDWSLWEKGTGSLFDPGRSGDGSFSYTASANRTLSPRTARVRVSFRDGAVLEYTVRQDAPTCAVTIAPAERTVPYAATSGSFAVHVSPSSCSWKAWIHPGIHPAWNLRASGGSVGDGTITYSANPTPTNLSSIAFWIHAVPSNPLDPPARFHLSLGGH